MIESILSDGTRRWTSSTFWLPTRWKKKIAKRPRNDKGCWVRGKERQLANSVGFKGKLWRYDDRQPMVILHSFVLIFFFLSIDFFKESKGKGKRRRKTRGKWRKRREKRRLAFDLVVFVLWKERVTNLDWSVETKRRIRDALVISTIVLELICIVDVSIWPSNGSTVDGRSKIVRLQIADGKWKMADGTSTRRSLLDTR